MSIAKLFVFVFIAKILILGIFLGVFGEGRLTWADSSLYIDLGRNVFLGNGFATTESDGSTTINTRFMPLYPFIIGLFSLLPHGLILVSILQAVAVAGIAVFTYKIALFFVPHRWALGAVLIVTFEPLISSIHILIIPETLFVLFLVAFVYFFLRYISISGKSNFQEKVRLPYIDLLFSLIALALATYTKPATLYLAVLPVLFFIFTRREFFRAGIFAGVFLLALIPWMARNAYVGGDFAVTNDDTGNICGWTLHGVIAAKQGVDPTDWSTTWNLPEYFEAQKQCTSPATALRLFLSEYPGAFLKTMTLSSISLLTNDGYTVFFEKPQEEQVKPHHNFLTPAVFVMYDWREKFSAALSEFSTWELMIIFTGRIFWFLVLISAFVGSVALLSQPPYRSSVLFVILVVLYFVCATVFVTAYGAGARLRYPLDAFLLILAAYGMMALPKMRSIS